MSLNSPKDGSQLCFRALQLSKPRINLDALQMKVDLSTDMQEGLIHKLNPEERSRLLQTEAFTDRTECFDPCGALGMDGSLSLPKNSDPVFLGETIRWFISLSNISSNIVSSVTVKLEMQNERARNLLLDTVASSTPSLPPGESIDFVVTHVVKDSGPHTLICTSQFTPYLEGDRKFNLRHFQFVVENPLSMRTKSMSMGLETFLEVRVENAMSKPLLLEGINFQPSELYRVDEIRPEKKEQTGPLKAYINSLQVVQPNKGSTHFMFKFTRIDETSGSTDESRVLGKMEIKWKNGISEPGRLFTQQIYAGQLAGGVGLNRDVHAKMVQIDNTIGICQPFKVVVQLWNKTKQAVGPMSLVLKKEKDAEDRDSAIVMNGVQSIAVEVLSPNASCQVPVVLLALETGVQTIQGLALVHESDGYEYGGVEPIQIFVA